MSVAILSGSSSGIGAHLAAKLLRCTALDVVALSSRPRVQTEEAIRCLTGKVDSRLTVLSVDGFGDADGDLEKARMEVESRWGKGQVRAIICSSGIVRSCSPDSASFCLDFMSVERPSSTRKSLSPRSTPSTRCAPSSSTLSAICWCTSTLCR